MTRDDIPPQHRAHRNPLSQWLGRTILKLSGWKLSGELPDADKIIVAIAPHTSNWDFVIGLSALLSIDLNIRWIGKHTIFRPPFRKLLMSLGGIPVDRDHPKGIVEQIADRMRHADQMLIGIMPEGTRSRVKRWKTGFLRIASAAQCKVLLVGMDYRGKTIYMGDVVEPRQDVEQQVQEVKAWFQQYQACRPELF